MIKYSLVYLKSERGILLIKKERPDWQKGKLNLIGGHVENGESYIEAAYREVFEETGLDIKKEPYPYEAINFVGIITGSGYKVAVFYGEVPEWSVEKVKTKTDEEVKWVPKHRLTTTNLMPNLYLMIPLIEDNKLFVLDGDSYPHYSISLY